ncbi:hypothetical protein H8M03_10655 [Sphingomonas sabuli]|uniref:Rap1a immunity protein domain-containing protein n=1 Tax=Sphingomonas sabuli TaxID=2764186 RepID=A0A7G9L1F9_9SPHN|nr:hypothetical protein [Sphingomonas sabuli]QNM82458.1 hypothetical protein H8M03_10655 [Sphingomonas sabuli]
MRIILPLLLAACVAAPASAQTMNAEAFHNRATKLKAKGPLALLSGGEIKALQQEGQAAGEAAAAQMKADKAAGRKTRFCAPPGPRKMGSGEFMERLSAIPAAQRARIDMTEAVTRIMAAKFPCRS